MTEVQQTDQRIRTELAHQQARLKALNYQQKLATLQGESVRLAKELSELETNSSWASGELSKLKAEVAELEAKDVAAEFQVTEEM